MPTSTSTTASGFNPGTLISGIRKIPTSSGFWEDEEQKDRAFPSIRFYGEGSNQRKKLHLGPGGAVGVGCGVGIGVGLVGGMGIGASPWNYLKIVIGLGAGCGVGIGYGFGLGHGILWDRPPPQKSTNKRIVINI